MNRLAWVAWITTDLGLYFRDLEHAKIPDNDFFTQAQLFGHGVYELIDDFRHKFLGQLEVAEFVRDVGNEIALRECGHGY